MSTKTLEIKTNGEGFVDITAQIKDMIPDNKSGVIFIQNTHTSCGLVINEAFDPLAKKDMENFLKYIAPDNLKFIEHTEEGPDDSPSHMKSILVQQTMSLLVEKGQLQLGQWQGVYLCEFRRSSKLRRILTKFISD